MDVRITTDFRDLQDFRFHGEWVGALIYFFPKRKEVYVSLRMSRRHLDIVDASDILLNLWEKWDMDWWVSTDGKLGTTRRFQVDDPREVANDLEQIYLDFTEH